VHPTLTGHDQQKRRAANQIESLRHNGNPLERKRRCSNIILLSLTLASQRIPRGRYAAPGHWSTAGQLQPCVRSLALRSRSGGWHGTRRRSLSSRPPPSSGCAPSPPRYSGCPAMSGSDWKQKTPENICQHLGKTRDGSGGRFIEQEQWERCKAGGNWCLGHRERFCKRPGVPYYYRKIFEIVYAKIMQSSALLAGNVLQWRP